MNLKQARALREIREHEAAGARPAVDYLESIMDDERTASVTLHIRVRPGVVEAIDALADELSRDPLATPGGALSRADVARMALIEGIRLLQARVRQQNG